MVLYCFDFLGHPVGHIDDEGVLCDSCGVVWGRLNGDDVFDLEGRQIGRIGPQGSFRRPNGPSEWYVRGWNTKREEDSCASRNG